MARSSARHSPRLNSHDGKNKLADRTPIKGSNRRTPIPAATHAFTPAAALVIALFAVSSSANSSVVRYLEDNL